MSRSDFTILIVDSEDTFRNGMSFDLKGRGYKVVTTPSVVKAIEFFPEMPFHLVLANAEEPSGGLTLLNYVKKLGKNIPVFLTFTDRGLDTAALVSQGATGAFRKPFGTDFLVEQIQRVAPLPDRFSYYLNVRRTLAIVSWVGELRASDGELLRKCAREALAKHPKFVILNLHDFRDYDSILAAEIVSFQEKATTLPAWLVLCGLYPALRERMASHGLIKEAQVLATLKDALQFVLDVGMK